MLMCLKKTICCILISILASVAISYQAAAADDLEIYGQWQQGGLLRGRVAPGFQLWIDERQLQTTVDGGFVFGLGRDQGKDFELTLVDAAGVKHSRHFTVAQRRYSIQKVNGVAQKHVDPPQAVLKRIQKEAALVKRVRKTDDKRTDFQQKFSWPLVGPITGVYGSQRVYNGVPKSPHYGLDIAGPSGSEVRAPAAGVITLAEADLYFSGGTLILDHGHGLSSTFIHLSKLNVKVGDRIAQGQIIAEVGATGRATGPHLDWRMNWFDARLDPALVMAGVPMPDSGSPKGSAIPATQE